MNERVTMRLLWTLSVATVVVGVGMTAQTMTGMAERERMLRRKTANLAKLQNCRDEKNYVLAAVRLFEELPVKQPASLPDIMKQAFIDQGANDLRESRSETAEGWVARRMEMVFNEIPFAQIMQFLQIAESKRPPWHLKTCAFRASSRPGVGEARLTMEALEKPGRPSAGKPAPAE